MATNITHHKAIDKSDKRQGKQAREREVLGWFKSEGYKHKYKGTPPRPAARKIMFSQSTGTKDQGQQPTAPLWPVKPPPPYLTDNNPPDVGQFPMAGILEGKKRQEIEGELQGKFIMTWTNQSDEGGKSRNRTAEEADSAVTEEDDEEASRYEESL